MPASTVAEGGVSLEFVIGLAVTVVGGIFSLFFALLGFIGYQLFQTGKSVVAATQENTAELAKVKEKLSELKETPQKVERLEKGLRILMSEHHARKRKGGQAHVQGENEPSNGIDEPDEGR